MNIERLLHEEIADELSDLKKMQVGTDDYKIAVDGITKLVDRAIELEKIESDSKDKVECREIDAELRLKQINEERMARVMSNVINVAGILIPTGLTIWGTYKTFKFEETGTITTQFGRCFINKLFGKK